LPAIRTLLNNMGLKYQLEETNDDDDDWGDLSDAEIEGIKAGLEDSAAGRVHSHAEVMAHINEKLKNWGVNNG